MKAEFFRFWYLPFVLLLFVGCGSPKDAPSAPPTGEKVALRLKMEKGDSKGLSMTVDTNINMGAGDLSKTMKVKGRFDMRFEVLAVDAEGNHSMHLKYERFKLDATGASEPVHFDSADIGDDDRLAQAIMPLLDQNFTLKMNPDGEIIELDGLDDVPDLARHEFQQSQNYRQLMSTLPKHPVDNGDTWTATVRLDSKGQKLTINATYTLLERKDGAADVRMRGKASGFVSGDVTGQIQIDLATGWVRDGAIKMELSGGERGGSVKMETDITLTGT